MKANAECRARRFPVGAGSLGPKKATWVTTWFVLTVLSSTGRRPTHALESLLFRYLLKSGRMKKL